MPARLIKGLFCVAGASVLLIALVLGFVCLLWLNDVHEDRKHVVVARASTPVFEGVGDEGGCFGNKPTVINEDTTLPVRRIRYHKDCATVDVLLPNGQQGYFILGIGDVHVEPALAK